jgi:hypothetical protein
VTANPGLTAVCRKCGHAILLPYVEREHGVPYDLKPLAAGWSYPDEKTGWLCPDCSGST